MVVIICVDNGVFCIAKDWLIFESLAVNKNIGVEETHISYRMHSTIKE